MHLLPGQRLPALNARLSTGEPWTLADESAAKLALVVFYRGFFCPVCRVWVSDLDKAVPEFEKRGYSVIALTCDDAVNVTKARAAWGIKNLRMAGELDPDHARQAGLYISEGRGVNPSNGEKEPRLFAEPGMLAVKPDGTLYAAWVQSVPYARPHFAEVLTALDTFMARDLPPVRGAA